MHLNDGRAAATVASMQLFLAAAKVEAASCVSSILLRPQRSATSTCFLVILTKRKLNGKPESSDQLEEALSQGGSHDV